MKKFIILVKKKLYIISAEEILRPDLYGIQIIYKNPLKNFKVIKLRKVLSFMIKLYVYLVVIIYLKKINLKSYNY